MDQTIRNTLRETVLAARSLLENAIREELQGRLGIYTANTKGRGTLGLVVEDDGRMGHLEPDERETRRLLLDHVDVLQTGGLAAPSALDTFVRETAFTWLNRFVAFKMLEARGLVRETVSRLENSNGFKMWLAEPGNETHLSDYEKGDLPQNGRGEGPRQWAYRAFLLAQCRKLSEEVRVLFDSDALVSRFLPQPKVLRELANFLNAPDLAPAWQPGNEETIGWVYQGFNSEELEQAFREVRISKKKFEAQDIPAVTQLFTPRWIVRFLVENTLGRLWLELHPDSQLAPSLDYLVPFKTTDYPPPMTRSVKEVTFLDPACGTMHFGLVAFDLFVNMYREEMQNAGKPGWPQKQPVASEEEISDAIIAHNLHGIDIDPRAVQLSALTLYLKAKTLNPKARISESRLACANVHMLDGDNLKDFVEQMKLGPIYRRILTALQARLKDSEQLGSLLRLEGEIRELVAEERERYKREKMQLFPGWSSDQFETEAGQREFWEILEVQIGQALDAFAREHFSGAEQTFFAGETAKGLRLLELMAQRYDVVVTNPPYMSTRKMNSRLKSLVAASYPAGKGDLYAAFIQRCVDLACPTGCVGMLTMHSFMFISSYEKLRSIIREQAFIETMAHAGPALFDVGNPGTLQTSAYVFRRDNDPESRQNAVGTYFRLVKEPDSEAKKRRFEQAAANLRDGKKNPVVYRYRQGDFDAIPGSPWVYWITPGLRKVFEAFPKLGEIAQPRQGLATADNFRFLRHWWEPGVGRIGLGCKSAQDALKTRKRWFPYMKGGGFCRWYGNQEYVVNWERDGDEIRKFADPLTGKIYSRPQNTDYYFRRGVTYSYLTSGNFSARLSLAGFIFDVAGSSLFPDDIPLVLAVLNSRFALYALRLINPTVNFQVGDLARLPVPKASSETLRKLVDHAIAFARADSEDSETTWDFIAPPDWPDGIQKAAERHSQLAEIERQIDEEVYRLYGISEEDHRAIEAELAAGGATAENEEDEEPGDTNSGETGTTETFWSEETLAKAWICYAVGVVMGQFEPGTENGLGRGRFDVATANHLQALKDEDGLLVVDPGHPDDLAIKVLAALEVIFGEANAESLIRQALANNGEPLAILRDYLADKFFKEHIQKYRKRPIYWYLRSTKGNYGLWLYYHRLDKDILFKALLNYVEPKIRLEEDRLRTLRTRKEAAGSSGREAKQIEKDMDRQEQFVSELLDFADRLRRTTNLHLVRDLNDSVVLNIAPLWELVPWKEAKENWENLVEGKYEWASIGKQMREKGLVKK
ncbi:BREX-1 system adenine-specific DNA-methyltransferase PglX [Leptospirillum ferriphilum]|uniref:BREX-1 system adenine-specific DNA-methyltransferase PglX n=1 Tax=Leptospirillum ferriphilum TaxID=178606 RepID=UPI0006B162C2|nr:BREX-1 system adenine-specific DNA-methyltransferase PglX [Leptospirillum ferriphilum]